MRMPGFAAENSAYRRDGVIVAARQQGGGNPHYECVADCVERDCFDKKGNDLTTCRNHCERVVCRDLTYGNLGGPASRASCMGECAALLLLCSLDPFMLLGCEAMWVSCTRECPRY